MAATSFNVSIKCPGTGADLGKGSLGPVQYVAQQDQLLDLQLAIEAELLAERFPQVPAFSEGGEEGDAVAQVGIGDSQQL